MQGPRRIRFGRCEIDVPARALLCDGAAQPVEPKVFDALVYLVAQRHRVVTKQELLEHVWGRRVVVSPGVIARTIMKLRRLIGDDADDPSIVKTVHRIGYRFAAAVDDADGPAAPVVADGAPAATTGRRRLAVLPFRDETANPEYAWIDLGLMSTLVDAIAAGEGEAGLVPPAQLLAVVGTAREAGDFEGVCQRLATALGPVDVVEASLACPGPGPGLLVLRYRGAGPSIGPFDGELRGADALELCRELALLLRLRLRHAGVRDDAPVDAVSAAAALLPAEARFASMAHARARQAMHHERWGEARKLLRVALDLQPDDLTTQLDHACCLAALRDPAAAALLDRVQARAGATGHRLLEMRATHQLATLRQRSGDYAGAEQLLSRALTAAEQAGDAETQLQLLVSMADVLADEGRPGVATWMLERADRLARALGHQLAIARLMLLRGRIDAYNGDAAAGLEACRDAAAMGERYGLHAVAALALLHLARALRQQGRMSASAEACERAFELACRSGHPHATGLSGCNAVLYAGLQRGRFERADALAEAMRGAGATDAAVDLARALVLARRGWLEDAAALLEDAERRLAGSPSMARLATHQHVRVLIALGMLDEAAARCDTLRAWAHGRMRPHVLGTLHHLQALVAAARGSTAQARQHLAMSIDTLPPSPGRASALLDAAWLQLEHGDVAGADATLAMLGPYLPASLLDGHAPSRLVQGRLVQQRQRGSVPVPGSGPIRCSVLPSLHDLMPDLLPVGPDQPEASAGTAAGERAATAAEGAG